MFVLSYVTLVSLVQKQQEKRELLVPSLLMMPHLAKWFNELQQRQELEQYRKRTGMLPLIDIKTLVQHKFETVESMIEVDKEQENRNWVSDRKNKTKVNKTSMEQLWMKFDEMGLMPVYNDNEEIRGVDWSQIPANLDPCAGGLTEDRAVRKRLQIDNLVTYAKQYVTFDTQRLRLG